MSTLRPIQGKRFVDDFFGVAATILHWDDLDDKVVMDIGCGRGYSSTTFVKKFPAIKRLIAIDNVSDRLDEAQSISHPKVEYIQADIANKITLDSWIGGIDVAISIFCFNCLADQKQGFENLFGLLRPMGHAAILQGLYSSFLDLFKKLTELPNWKFYTENVEMLIPESHYQKYTAVHYRKLFEEIGFEVVECTNAMKTHTYASDAECRDAIFKLCPSTDIIPEERKIEFKTDLFEIFLKHNTRNDDGLLYMTHGILSVLLIKPEESKRNGESKE